MWRFLRSEMLVILGLVEDADRTDAEIAEAYGMNKGTVASVRKRLLDSGAISIVNVPSFNKLGCELMSVHIGSTDPAVTAEAKANEYVEFCGLSPNIIHGVIGGGNLSLHAVFRDATELQHFLQEHSRFFSGRRRQSKARLDTVVFPYGMTKGTFAANFAPVVHRYFALDVPPPKARPSTLEEVIEPDLSENEANCLVELVADPLSPDRRLASKVGLSRQTVTRIRQRLFDERYLTTICVPRLYKWGFELYVLSHAKFNMDVRWDIRLKSQPAETSDLPFFALSKADESVTNHMVSRYQEYADGLERLLAWFHKTKAFEENPRIMVFPLDRSTELRSMDFLPAVKHILAKK